ncbi:MAG: hypothetical protein U5P41_03165 [Gammaproteobacteria bacterium]|nr:hypothetical protein [Gammaproteobacteria bacterium]
MRGQWFSGIFRYAVATLRAESDPAGALKGAIEKPKTQHHQPLSQKEIPKFLEKLEARGRLSPQLPLHWRSCY